MFLVDSTYDIDSYTDDNCLQANPKKCHLLTSINKPIKINIDGKYVNTTNGKNCSG